MRSKNLGRGPTFSTRNCRINVVGTSGSGKTTLAEQLAQKLGVPHIELDALHWEPNWTEAPAEVLRERVDKALSGPGWTVDGNYSKVRDIIVSRADTIIWLDYSLSVIMYRVIKRTLHRALTHQELWSGNRESLGKAFFSRESIIWWAFSTYKRRRREFPQMLAGAEYDHITILHFQSPREAARWLASVSL